jgi:hypothetical protein
MHSTWAASIGNEAPIRRNRSHLDGIDRTEREPGASRVVSFVRGYTILDHSRWSCSAPNPQHRRVGGLLRVDRSSLQKVAPDG